jgi:5-methylthioadenosine/S-adenosylhomocysteine deaminase
MERIDTLVNARWIAPVEPDSVLENHALAIRAGRIVAVLPEAEARARYAADEVLERPGHLLTPGLVNAHTRAASSLYRGPGARAHAGREATPESVRDAATLAIAEMLAGGITAFGDADAHPDVVATAAVEAGMRAAIALPIATSPSAWAAGADEYFDRALTLHDEYREHPLVATAFAVESVAALDDATLRRLKVLVDQLEAPLVVQLHESSAAVAQCRERHGLAPLARLERLGLANASLVGVHFVAATAEDVALAARSGLRVVHCPTANLRLGRGMAPVPALLEAGVTVCLGTDGADGGSAQDVLGELRLALLLASGTAGRPDVLSPAQGLRMATLAGAEALGLERVTGSLAPGKWADVTCFDLDRTPALPPADPLDALAYAAGRDFVSDVWVAGRRLVTDGLPSRPLGAELAARVGGRRGRGLAGHAPAARESHP